MLTYQEIEKQTSPALPRWVLASTTRRAHLDLGERSSQSLRVKAEHIIVTASHAHLDGSAPVAPEAYNLRCSNCLRIWRKIQQEEASTAGSDSVLLGKGSYST